MSPKSDIEIARAASKQPIQDIGAKLGIPSQDLLPFGHDKAKVSAEFIKAQAGKPDGKLILVTAINPTPAGEGKTTTTVGLVDGLNAIGKQATVCIREASLGPCFGMKGGAAGGGYAQVVPMEEMNLHFTGDFHAITSAHNLLSAMIDNHIYWGNELGIDQRRVSWRRVVDMNDRALRDIVTSLGGVSNGFPRQAGFDITVASEGMAILCLANDIEDLQKRLGDIIVAYRRDRSPVFCRDIKADGAMTVLLAQAMQPNLVQTLENNPAFVHGGPFANIAHGCNSVLATRMALHHADWAITEAGFASWDEKCGRPCSGSTELDLKNQAYCIKVMLMDVTRTANNSINGSRLAPWLRGLVQACRQPAASLEDAEQHADSRSASRSLSVGGHDEPQTPTRDRTQVRKILVSPATTSSATSGSTSQSTDESPSSVRSFTQHTSVRIEELAEMPNTGTQKKTKYIYDWNEGVGGTRCAVDGDDMSWESVASNLAGKGGYILCAWTDGHVWESDKPNMYLEFLNMGPLKKKKGNNTVAQKTPAATTKKPTAKKPSVMTTPVKKFAMKN